MKKITLCIFPVLAFSSCTIVRERSVVVEAAFESVAYDPCSDEYTFWLRVPYQSSELGMARVPRRNVSVSLRTDGKSYTSIFLKEIKHDPSDYFHKGSSATILVPLPEDVEVWKEFINKEKERFAVNIRASRIVPKK